MRLKGNIAFELENVFSDFSFKTKYKKELSERINHFLNYFLIRNSFPGIEGIKKLDHFFKIKNGEIVVLKEEFLNIHKEALFNSFNPLWYSNKKEGSNELKQIRRALCLSFINKLNSFEKIYTIDNICQDYYQNIFSFFFDKKNSLNVVSRIDDIHIEKEIIDCWNLESTNSYQLNRDLYFGIPNNKFFKNISFENKELYLLEKNKLIEFLEKLISSEFLTCFSTKFIKSELFIEEYEDILNDFNKDIETSYYFTNENIFNVKTNEIYEGSLSYLISIRKRIVDQILELIEYLKEID